MFFRFSALMPSSVSRHPVVSALDGTPGLSLPPGRAGDLTSVAVAGAVADATEGSQDQMLSCGASYDRLYTVFTVETLTLARMRQSVNKNYSQRERFFGTITTWVLRSEYDKGFSLR